MQRPGCGDSQHAGAGTEIEHAARTPGFQDMIEQQQAAARRAVVSGAERQRRLDFDAELVGRDPLAVMLAVDNEAPGRYGDEVFEAGLDLIPGLDCIEHDALGEVRSCRIGHEFADQWQIRRLGKMRRDVPLAVRPFERGNRGLALEKNFGQGVDDGSRCLLVTDGKADAIRGGRGYHRRT